MKYFILVNNNYYMNNIKSDNNKKANIIKIKKVKENKNKKIILNDMCDFFGVINENNKTKDRSFSIN